jgi:hypothetical protein
MLYHFSGSVGSTTRTSAITGSVTRTHTGGVVCTGIGGGLEAGGGVEACGGVEAGKGVEISGGRVEVDGGIEAVETVSISAQLSSFK